MRLDPGPLDVATPRRTVALELIAGRSHYERVIRAVLNAHTSVWIATSAPVRAPAAILLELDFR